MATKEQNQKYFNDATSTLNKLAANLSTPKNIRKNITDLINDLKTGDYPVSVRAAYNSRSKCTILCQDFTMAGCINIREYKRINF